MRWYESGNYSFCGASKSNIESLGFNGDEAEVNNRDLWLQY